METIHEIIKESVSGSFFRFIGYLIIIYVSLQVPAAVIMFAINRPLRHLNINKHGYPPAHCDADGDFKEETKQD